jgi:hypothetical protein
LTAYIYVYILIKSFEAFHEYFEYVPLYVVSPLAKTLNCFISIEPLLRYQLSYTFCKTPLLFAPKVASKLQV